MRVLIAFGSKLGGTEGLAHAVAEGLIQAGHEVDVRPAKELDGIEAWDAVVVGGGLYASRWHRQARRFVERHEDELLEVPVWFFSSGPLDDSAKGKDIPPTTQVRRLMEAVQARGHITFGGRLEAGAKGFIAHALAKQGRTGDWRDLEGVKAWGRSVAVELQGATSRRAAVPIARVGVQRTLRRVLGILCLFTGLTALLGGASLLGWPMGAPRMVPPLSLLEHTPFSDYFVPGLLLFWVVGMGNTWAGALALRRTRGSEVLAFGAGTALLIWICAQMAIVPGIHWLQLLYLGIALATMVTALRLRRLRRGMFTGRPPRQRPRPTQRAHGAHAQHLPL